MASREDAVEQLKREIAQVAVDEILALCYAFSQKPDRLRLYLDVLRRRGGQRAQFAACVICFDLARQGDVAMQKEFVYLAGAIRSLMRDHEFVANLLGNDPYLTFIWELMSAQIEEMDSRFETEHTAEPVPTAVSPVEVADLDLLSDDDFADELGDLDFDVDHEALELAFAACVDRFLGKLPNIPAYYPHAGFRFGHRGDTERLEQFILELDSLRGPVARARAFRALVLLFYGSHMRSKSLFGAVNERKQKLLRDGLAEFEESGPEVWRVASVVLMHGEPSAWQKVAEILLDFTHWRLRHPPQECSVELYPAVERQITRDRARGGRRFGSRGSGEMHR